MGKLVAIAAGGTAGHVNPALALAEELRERGYEVVFFGQEAKLEGRLVPEAGFELCPVVVSGFDRERPWTGVSALAKAVRAMGVVKRRLKDDLPSAAVGFGAYVEVPLLSWCHTQGVPTVIHEQNSVTGLANRMMAEDAACVCVSFPEAKDAFAKLVGDDAPIVETGNPVRRSVVEGDGARARERRKIPLDASVLVVFGGSLGARSVNEAVVALKQRLLAVPGLHVIHATGSELFDETRGTLSLSPEEEGRWHLSAYVDDMGDVLAASDLALCRSGASSVAELAAAHVPAVLVPYPHATENHQRTNAMWLVRAGAAEIVDDAALGTDAFAEALLGLATDADARAAMRSASASLASDRAAGRLADEVERVIR